MSYTFSHLGNFLCFGNIILILRRTECQKPEVLTGATHQSTVINENGFLLCFPTRLSYLFLCLFNSCLRAEISVSCQVKKSSRGVVATGVVGKKFKCFGYVNVLTISLFFLKQGRGQNERVLETTYP